MSEQSFFENGFLAQWAELSDRYAMALERWQCGDLSARAEVMRLAVALRRMSVCSGGDRSMVPLTITPPHGDG